MSRSSFHCLHVAPEISKQRVRVSEVIRLLDILHVPMVALARLVIVAQHANPIDNQRQPILERMARTPRRPRQPPNRDLDERTRVKHVPFIGEQLGFHVGGYNNVPLLSKTQTVAEGGFAALSGHSWI